jgi:hypothetical protein
MPDGALPIPTICAEIFSANANNCQTNCSGYLKQVAGKLAVALPDQQANELVDALSTISGWQQLGNDARKASDLAGQGCFVVAGLKEAGHGHVAVVVPGWATQGFPIGYWGSLKGAAYAGANKSLTWAWTRPDLALVKYFALARPKAEPEKSK